MTSETLDQSKIERVPIAEIAEIFSRYSDQLREGLRFMRYHSGENPEEWIRLLGPDVSFLRHPSETAKITEEFIKLEPDLSQEERLLSRTWAWVHDLGELRTEGEWVGDLPSGKKSHTQGVIEMNVWRTIMGDYFQEHPDRKVSKEIIERAYYAAHSGPEFKDRFGCIHYIGFLSVAIRAFDGVEEERIKNWKGLVGSVISNQIPWLIDRAEKYPYVKHLFDKHSSKISEMFLACREGPVPNDARDDPAFNKHELSMASMTWYGFVHLGFC